MLQLRSNNYEFDGLISQEYKRVDYNIRCSSSTRTIGYIRSKYVESVLAPLAFNEIGIMNMTFGCREEEHITQALTAMEEAYENLSQTRLGMIRIYVDDVDAFCNRLGTDLYTSAPTAVQELYNKCMDQVRLREGINRTLNTRIRITRGKHMIVLVTDYDDNNQASDFFLTVGLIPILFQDWKEKFNEEELEFFKVLVNRSQVKRISNVKPQEAFETMINGRKYKDLINTIRLSSTIESIVSSRINSARRVVNDAEQQSTRLLAEYQSLKAKFYEANETLSNLEKSREDAIEELKLALNTEGVVKAEQYDNQTLKITINVPALFYASDEAEIVIGNMSDGWIKNFWKDVFVDQKYKLMLVSEFYFSYANDRRFQDPGEIDANVISYYNSIFNPHTYFFRCLGDYKPQLIDAQAKQDLLMFINLAVASVKSINFRDGAVVNRWKEALAGYSSGRAGYVGNAVMNAKCLIDEEGNAHSLMDVYFEPRTIEVEDTL